MSDWIATCITTDGDEQHFHVEADTCEEAIDRIAAEPVIREVVKCLRGYRVSPPSDSAITVERGEGS